MKIKKWFKFFGLSFFSDKIAKQAPKFGFTNILLALILSFLFFLFGFYSADVVPFATHYKNAEKYRHFINDAFSEISIQIKSNKAICEKTINSYTSDVGYAKNGYNLIVDTRPADMLIKFYQIAVKGEDEISYEDYRSLNEAQKASYKVLTRFTDEELVITAEQAKKYKDYLSTDENAKTYYESLKAEAEDYNEQLYYLYVKFYHTSVTSVLYGARAPVLRDFYYRNYIANDNANYFYIFDSMMAGSFKTDKGIPVEFGGYFNKCSDGAVEDIDGLINKAYYDTAGNLLTSYFVGARSQFLTLLLIPVILGLIMWGTGKLVKCGWEKTFGGCYKTVNAFVWFSALLTALVTFSCGWFVSARAVYPFMPLIFAVILFIRTAVLCITDTVKNKKKSAESEQIKEENLTA